MPRAKNRRGRPLSKDWKETGDAAHELGLTPDHLLKLRTTLLTAGKHWRCKNPTVSPRGRRYLFNVKHIGPLLIPDSE